jgi:phage anti-repressor protein
MATVLCVNINERLKNPTVKENAVFYVCKKINNKWHTIKSNSDFHVAFNMCKALIQRDLIERETFTTEADYALFKKEHSEIQTKA